MKYSAAALLLLLPAGAWAQAELDLAEGKAIFRGNCAFCHGLTGAGGRGPNLISGRFLHGSTDDNIKTVIRSGVPGSTMPSFETMQEDELNKLVQYIRSLSGSRVKSEPVPGDPAKGRLVYAGIGCAGCHRVGNEGSVFGPELTRIGAGRSSEYIRESILNPSADIPLEFEGVTVVTKDGERITGVRVNEDTFSVQLRDVSQNFRSFQKSGLREVIHESKSLMPAYHSFPSEDLQNLLAWLDSLRGESNAAPPPMKGQVTPERLVNAAGEPQSWLTYWGDYGATHHRDLHQIDKANVKDLRLEWIFQTGQTGAFETVPLVIDGVMYLTGGNGSAYALDARSGRQLWMYKHTFPAGRKAEGVNRGLAALGDRVFMVTPDANIVALEARSGRLLWQTEMAPYNKGQYTATLAPLAIKDKIITGVSGGEYGIRGFIDAYDAVTGKRVWRFYTVPLKGEPGGETWLGDSGQRGGGATWMTGTYDPQLNTVYWGVGNPGPDLYGEDRRGDNLYTCALVALDPDSGKLKWHYQFSPHDLHDWDAAETPMLLDLNWKGRPRKLVVQANRNAFFYVLDRETGEFLMARPFARQNWAKEIDSKGRPVRMPNSDPTPEGTHTCPGLAGAANWMAPSFNPQTGWFYFPVREQCDEYYTSAPVYIGGKPFWGSVSRGVTNEKEWGLLKALDPLTGETKWDYRYYRAPWAGTLSTSGGLIFAGDEDGYLMAFDAKTGANLWKVNTGNRLVTAPITYMLDGRQYVTMPSGAALLTFALP